MNKPKSSKGITLVALIITIIVLLILTVVAIRAITGEGVLDKAKIAANSYEDKRREEENILGSYSDIIDANMPQNTAEGGTGGENSGANTTIDINKLKNKAYSYQESNGNYVVFYLVEESDGFKFKTNVFDVETEQPVSDDDNTQEGGPRLILPATVSTEFDQITIYIDGVEKEIKPANAIFIEPYGFYLTEDAIYTGVSNGTSMPANSDKMILRSTKWDSKIN